MLCFVFLAQENGNVASGQDAAALLTPCPTGPAPHPCISKLNPGFVPSNPGTPRVSPNVTPHHTDDELDTVSDHPNVNKPRVKRQRSRGKYTCMLGYSLSIIVLYGSVLKVFNKISGTCRRSAGYSVINHCQRVIQLLIKSLISFCSLSEKLAAR